MYKDRIYATLCLIKWKSEWAILARFIIIDLWLFYDTHTHLNVDNLQEKNKKKIDFAAELGVIKMNIIWFFDKTTTIDKSL